MMRYARANGLVGLSVLVLILGGCGGSPHGSDVALPSDAIRDVLVGNSIEGDNWDGPYTVYFASYGEMRGVRSSHYKDEGTWRVEDDAICAKWQNWWGAVERCFGIYLDGDKVNWRRPDTEVPDRARLVEGNPAAL
jgi:hypothetical protein